MDTTIPIKHETRNRLKAFGRFGETYDELLNRLLDRLDVIEALATPKVLVCDICGETSEIPNIPHGAYLKAEEHKKKTGHTDFTLKEVK